MKLFITKYALKDGIEEVEGKISNATSMAHWTRNGVWDYAWNNKAKNVLEWHLTREEAATRADEMRVSKIASLKKQITKLEGLKFV